ncbi:MAG: hypothetical protein Kow0092_32800 [Deferrisomatales bacterium]
MRGLRAVTAVALGVVPALVAPAAPEQAGPPEGRGAELYHTPAERRGLGREVSLSGLVEIEARWERRDSRSASDLSLATAQLAAEF